ncbi:nad-dependent aldehyde dehydrogenase [Ophiocordyceps camponoti-floridani]|uniref:aldehyde dehydrogenase (NAD(+)) n=1 Tax=Ophiocordyceps camponoti-floridani TaxID=2030778 RepID=A0A8H4Q896_9HYPO|nr:nad-dependent aldehyde dehydrogenase [Ophiocordyceps camponoti-floridani]
MWKSLYLGLVNPSSPAAVDRAVTAAAHAQRRWAGTSFKQRRAVLRSLLRHVLDNAGEICRVAALDSGKTLADAHLGELLVTAERIRWTISNGERALRTERKGTSPLMAHKRNSIRYEPLGVVAALVSWNYPFHNMLGPVISSLFAGNAIIVKVSEQTAWSAAYFCAIARGALVANGHDGQLVHALVCWPPAASHLVSHPLVRHVTFIGSRDVARKVAVAAAKGPKPMVAELGGKDACLVLDSASSDLDRIVEVILRGTFQAAGQNCIGIERVIASNHDPPSSIYTRLITALEPRIRALRLGPEADNSSRTPPPAEPASSSAELDTTTHLTQKATTSRPPSSSTSAPTCPSPRQNASPRSSASSPAPPPPLLHPPLANAPDFGLGASVFARESDPNLDPIISGLRTGMVAVNDFAAYYPASLPFGGVAGSGYGRFAGEEGLRGLCNAKSVCEDRFAWLGVRTAIPRLLRYPVAQQSRAWEFAHGLVEIAYGGFANKLRGLRRVLRSLYA